MNHSTTSMEVAAIPKANDLWLTHHELASREPKRPAACGEQVARDLGDRRRR
jgi:hypothetical protein